MGFFDDLGKKANKLSQDVAKKTKNISEIARLNREINITKNKINDEYKNIGSQVYEGLLAGKQDARFKDAFKTIKESIEFITNSEDRILELKEITVCPECGEELDMECAFCGKCGAKIERPEKPEPEEAPAATAADVKCKECGAGIPADSDFCPSCGAKK
jgi:ribosomal protein L40E